MNNEVVSTSRTMRQVYVGGRMLRLFTLSDDAALHECVCDYMPRAEDAEDTRYMLDRVFTAAPTHRRRR